MGRNKEVKFGKSMAEWKRSEGNSSRKLANPNAGFGIPEEYGGRIGHSLQKTRKIYRQTGLVSQLDAGKVKGEAGGEGVRQGHKGEPQAGVKGKADG